MKRKQILTGLLASAMLASSVTSVSAGIETTDISGQSGTDTTAEVDSTFSVLPTDLSGIIVSIPANLDLTLGSDGYFSGNGVLAAKGDLDENYILEIAIEPTATYNNSKGNTYEADVAISYPYMIEMLDTFPDFLSFTPAYLEEYKVGADRNLGVSVKLNEKVKHAGDYSGVVTFNISVQRFWSNDVPSFTTCDEVTTFTAYELTYNSSYNSTAFNTDMSTQLSSNNGHYNVPKYVGDSSDFYGDLVVSLGSNFMGNNAGSLKTITLPNTILFIQDNAFQNCTALTNITYKGTIADAKNISVGNNKLGSIDWTSVSDENSTEYILGHATWHCTDGDFVPANAE